MTTEKTTNHLGWALMFFIGSPVVILVLFAFCFGTIGPLSFVVLPILFVIVPIGVIIGWVNAVSKTKRHNVNVAAKRHEEMMIITSRAVFSIKI